MAIRMFRPLWLPIGLSLAACGSPASPSESSDLVIAGGESGHVAYLNSRTGTVVALAPFTLGPVVASSVDTSRTTAYLTAINPSGRELMAIDLGSGTIDWRLPMADVTHMVSYDGVQLFGEPVALFADNRTLAIGNALRDQTIGVAAFNPIARTVSEFRGPLDAYGFVVLPSSGSLAAFVNTGRGSDGRISFSILILVPNGLQTLDSIAPAPPYDNPTQLSPAPDGDRLYVGTYTLIYCYSQQQRRITAFVNRPAFGDIAVSPDGESVVVSDEGTSLDDPGSGKLFVYDQSLSFQKTIDLSPAGRGVSPVVTHRLSFSRDGRWLFVAAGTNSIGPLYAAQPAQVLVIDARTFQFVKAIPLNDWGSVLLFPLR